MSDLSKKIAIFEQKNNNKPNNLNTFNNNIKYYENKGNNERKVKFKNELVKIYENSETLNKNNNQKNNIFQKKLSIFETKEKNNVINKKLEVNKKENKSQIISSEKNRFSIKKENENKIEKNNILTNKEKEKEEEKENEKKITFSELLNIFNNNKNENKSKNNHIDKSKTTFIKYNNKIENDLNQKKNNISLPAEDTSPTVLPEIKKEDEKKSIISEKINIFDNNKKQNVPKKNSSKIISTINKKENESKEFPIQIKNIIDINKKENKLKQLTTDYNNFNIKKIENNNNNFNKIIKELKNPKNEIEISPLFRNSTLNNYDIINKLNNNINETNSNNIKSEYNTNLNINGERKNLKPKNDYKSSKNVTSNHPALRKTATHISFNRNFNNVQDIGEIFLNSEIIPENVMNDTFCLGFFIASFNIDEPQLIENSLELCSDCGHNLCSSTLAITPEIIFRYPQKDGNDFEISELGASICFPNGIKICYDKNEMHVKTLKNYSSILTNQNGKRYYMVTYHYYYKLPNKDFNTNSNYYKSLDTQIADCIINNKYIYIPYCICLLSKYPYFNQMDKCLECMRFSLDNHELNPSEIYNLITYFIKSIPIPPIGTKLFLPIPYYSELISINQPFFKDVIIFGDNPIFILEYLSVEEIILIFRLLLFEQKLLIVGNNYDVITQFTYNFTLLLYPLQWVHTYISIMTEKMIKYLQSFLPFFNGMHFSLYELTGNILESIKENIFIININKHTFELNTFPNLNTKNVIKKINEIVPQLPKKIYNYIIFGLGVLKSYYDKKKEEKNFNIYNMDEMLPLNIKIKQVFIQVFIEILYDYKNYLSVIGDKPIFNINGLLEQRPKNEWNFYKELTQTQLFQMFIQNNSNTNSKNDTFFEEQLETYSKCKVRTEFKQEFINNCNCACDIYKYYIIKYDDINNYDIKNKIKISIKNNDDFELRDYKKYIKQKYCKYDSFFKMNAIRNFNKRVLKKQIKLEHSKIPPNYRFYIIPNQEFNFEVERRKKSIRIKNENITTSLMKNNIENELTIEEKDDIKENIIDILTKIFKNEEISDVEDNKKLIMDSLKSDYGKELYSQILYQNSNILNESSFQFLKDIIDESVHKKILKINVENKKILYCVRLMITCQNFRKEENKKYIYLSDVLFPKFQKIPFISKFEFWEQWALALVQKDSKKSMDDKWVDSLKNIEIAMTKMGFSNNKSKIYSTIADLAKRNIHDKSKFLNLMKDIVDHLGIYKKF